MFHNPKHETKNEHFSYIIKTFLANHRTTKQACKPVTKNEH